MSALPLAALCKSIKRLRDGQVQAEDLMTPSLQSPTTHIRSGSHDLQFQPSQHQSDHVIGIRTIIGLQLA